MKHRAKNGDWAERKRIGELEGLYAKAKAERDEAAMSFSKEHDRAEFLMRENAKLREQTELLIALLRNDCNIEASWDGLRKFWNIGLTEDGCLMRDRACKAEAENAKLRQLVETLRDYIAGYTEPCDFCAMQGTCENHPAPPPCKYELDVENAPVLGWIDDILSELGIEVK